MVTEGRDAGATTAMAVLICSEFAEDNAGSHRQTRWAQQYCRLFSRIVVVYPRGGTRIAAAEFTSADDVQPFRMRLLQPSRLRKTTHAGRFAGLLRFAKHALLGEFFALRQLLLVFRLIHLFGGRHDVKAISISSPPFPFAFYSVLMTKALGIGARIHIDMRDPWATHKALAGFGSFKRFLERWCLSRADVLTVATRFMAAEFDALYGTKSRVVYNVATHVSASELRDSLPRMPKHPIRVLYVGTMPEGFYDVQRLADWLTAIEAEPGLKGRYQWQFVGECERLRQCLRGEGRKATSFVPRVPHKEAVAAMCSADVLLFLGHRFPGYLTTKLFEYLTLRKPLLPLFLSPDAEAYGLIKDICGVCPSILTLKSLKSALTDVRQLPRPQKDDALLEMHEAYGAAVRQLLA